MSSDLITIAGLFGNFGHWAMGAAVQRLGADTASIHAYYPIYTFLAAMVLFSMLGLPCLHAIRKREGLEETVSDADSALRTPHSALK